MRILVATHNFPRHPGDHAGSFVARLCRGIADRDHSVLVVAPHAPGAASAETIDGVRVQRFRYAPDVLERVAYRGDLHRRRVFEPIAAIGIPALLGAFALAIRRELDAFRPDVVHAHWWFPAGTLALRAAAPLVITCHGSDVRLLDRGGPVRRLGRATLRAAGAVTTASRFLAEDVTRQVPDLRGRVRTIYMPLDMAPFVTARGTPRADPPVILHVGNLVPDKGVDVLVEAFALLRRQGFTARLRIVGQGTEEGRLRASVRAAALEDAVEWAGVVPHHDIATEYARGTVVVLASRGRAEGLGLVLAEALATHTAVVATAAGGIPEVVRDGETGLVARDGDAAHLAAQIGRLLGDADLRRRLADAGAAHVEHTFAADTAAAAFEGVYRQVSDKRLP